jgi:hypothetical protein
MSNEKQPVKNANKTIDFTIRTENASANNAESESMKSWVRLFDAAKKITSHKQEEENRQYPWRRPFFAAAPDVAKPSLKRDFELGLVYPITEEVSGARKACNLDPMPPTAHQYPDQAEKKRKLIKDLGVGEEVSFDTQKRVYDY